MPIFTPDVSVDNTVLVDGSAVVQPVSATSLPLPTGAATDASVTALTKPSDTQLVDGSAHTQPVSGTVAVSGTVPVSGPLTDTQLRASPVPVTSGSVSSATVTRPTVTTVVSTILTARAGRLRVVIFNEAGTLFVKAGTAASATDYTWRLTANTELDVTDYTGILTATKASGSSSAQVTDF